MSDIHKQFFRMESEKELFSLMTSSGIFFWDLIRADLFAGILEYKRNGKIKKVTNRNFLKESIKNSIKLIINRLTLRYLIAKNPRYIFTTFQRKAITNGYVDEISDHLFELISNESICLEYSNKKSISSVDILMLASKIRLYPVLITSGKYDADSIYISGIIGPVLTEYFDIHSSFLDVIDLHIKAYRQQYKYFSKLLKVVKPKAFICNNNNSLKALFRVAKEYQVKTIELQHGASPMSLTWTYPDEIKFDSPGVFMPDYFLLFSNIWKDIYKYPVKNLVSIGNDNFFSNKVNGDGGILFISNRGVHDELLKLAIQTSQFLNTHVYYKLHPEQYSELELIKKLVSSYGNLVVLTDEFSRLKLFSLCEYIVGVRSTFFYEALQAGKTILIFRYSNYHWDEYIVKFAFFFDNAIELLILIKDSEPGSKNSQLIYFDKFNPNIFMSVING